MAPPRQWEGRPERDQVSVFVQGRRWADTDDTAHSVQVGPRPYYLVDNMDDGDLKDQLEACSEKPISTSHFSISHRGAPLMFPEHTKQGYIAAARMGAGKPFQSEGYY